MDSESGRFESKKKVKKNIMPPTQFFKIADVSCSSQRPPHPYAVIAKGSALQAAGAGAAQSQAVQVRRPAAAPS